MAKFIALQTTKTYASEANAIAAVEKKFGGEQYHHLTYVVLLTAAGRYYPAFLGERAIQAGVHFHFHVLG